MFINIHIIPSYWRTCQTVSIFSYVWGFGVMQVHELIVGWFKQAFHNIFANPCRILHTSIIRKRRVRAPSFGLVIVVPHWIGYNVILIWPLLSTVLGKQDGGQWRHVIMHFTDVTQSRQCPIYFAAECWMSHVYPNTWLSSRIAQRHAPRNCSISCDWH